MSFDITLDARQIGESWPAVVKLPADLAGTLAAFDEAEWVQPAGAGIPVEKITVKNVAEAVQSLSQLYAVEEAHNRAQRDVRKQLAARVLALAAAHTPALIEQVTPAFDKAVAEFRETVESLPDNHTPTALLAAGGSAVDAYHRAIAAQQQLRVFAAWINSMYTLPGFTGCRREPALILVTATNRAELTSLLNAKPVQGSELNPVYLTAIQLGLKWGLHDPATAQQIADGINSQPVVKKPIQFARLAR